MKFGSQLKVYRAQWDDMEAYVETMEAGRRNSIWFPDHFLPPTPIAGIPTEEDEQNPAWEAFVPLAVVAGMTKRLILGSLVLGNTYRNPALVAKMAAELDQASRGRFILGIGAGWFEREHQAYGWNFPGMKERQDRLEEACAMIRRLFTEAAVDFDGEFYQLERAPLAPGCYQKPHLPIMVGGNGERRTLRTLARYGDIYNFNGWSGMDVDVFKHKRNVLDEHCEAIDRDPAEIMLTVHYPLRIADSDAEKKRILAENPNRTVGSRNFHIDLIGKFADAGVTEMCCATFNSVEDLQQVDEEIIAAFS
jgi:alkanesulfonate monooxygenase SsuD/methylene tetrahydromethanopterin reductase-like flavin-dependent oxidoreductase (luciferase family)